MNPKILTFQEEPQLSQAVHLLHKQFPPFIVYGDPVSWNLWNEVGLYKNFPSYQFALRDEENEIIGCGHTIPLYWNGRESHLPSGYDDSLKEGFKNKKPNTLCGLAAITSFNHKGKGYSYALIHAMKRIAEMNDFTSVILPVRPTWKQHYPIISIDHYASWERDNGEPFDPWLRVHWRLGGVQLQTAPRSMYITGTIQQWEGWTGMSFPETGRYKVPGALSLVNINIEKNYGEYYDPNVWVVHHTHNL